MKLNGAEILIDCLQKEGVEHIFGYPGGATLHIYDALEAQEEIIHVLVRHEQGAAHAACLLYTSPSPRDRSLSRMPSSA